MSATPGTDLGNATEALTRLADDAREHVGLFGDNLIAQDILAIEAAVRALVEALGAIAPRCDCGELGVWNWSDEDGEEWKCDSHKKLHFYAHGPTLDADAVAARAALAPFAGLLKEREP